MSSIRLWNTKNEVPGSWMILDPTFNLIPIRAADSTFATVGGHHRNPAASWGIYSKHLDNRPYNYYLDYPLLTSTP